MASMIATIFILVFAQSIEMLMAGGILCGIPWGGEPYFRFRGYNLTDSLPNAHDLLRCRDLSNGYSRTSYFIRQYLLGQWSFHRRLCCTRYHQYRIRLGMEITVYAPVGLAGTTLCDLLLCPRK
jgi:hypothetical protein